MSFKRLSFSGMPGRNAVIFIYFRKKFSQP